MESKQQCFLKTDGIDIRDSSGAGEVVGLYGTNLGGWLVHEAWMSPLVGARNEWDCRKVLTERFGEDVMETLCDAYRKSWLQESDFARIAAEGVNCVRLPIYYLNHMAAEGNWRRKADGTIDFDLIEFVVENARAQGMYTILDLHGAPGSQNSADHSGQQDGALLYSDPRYQEMYLEFWRELATRYKGDPAIAGYDILNEPSERFPEPMEQPVVDLYDRCYRTIREVDPDHIIFMEAIWNWDRLPSPKEYGWENVVYSLHYYDRDISGDPAKMKEAVQRWVTGCREWMERYQVPHLAGEFNVFTNAEVWAYALKLFVDAGWNWTSWTYKVKINRGHWGMYHGGDATENIPDVAKDSAETIAKKWSAWDTETHFTRDPAVCDAMKAATDYAIEKYGRVARPQ